MKIILRISAALAVLATSHAMDEESVLNQGFANPPMSARPWMYWWFLGGYGNKEGIARDTDAYRQAGIGGMLEIQTYARAESLPAGPKMLSDQWGDWFGAAVHSAGEQGLAIIASDVDGWGYGGGWVSPEEESKRLVYSQIQVDGPLNFARPLPVPSRNSVYREVAVLAYPVKGNTPIMPATVTASSVLADYCNEQNWPAEHAADGDPNTYWRAQMASVDRYMTSYYDEILLGTIRQPPPISAEHPTWLQLSFHSPLAAAGALVVARSNAGPKECKLLASDDGKEFRPILGFSLTPGESRRLSFPKTTAKIFRLQIDSAYTPDVQVAEFAMLRQGDEPVLRPGISWWDFKSANRGWWRWEKGVKPYHAMEAEYPEDGAKDLRHDQVVDLTGKLGTDGQLTWDVPSGRWVILRFGWTGLNQRARPAVNGGWEVDPLGERGADVMADKSQKHLLEFTEKAGVSQRLQGLHYDSWELGADVRGQQPNWTWDFREKFKKYRGYDLLPYLPAMARCLVDDRQTTERFLRDYRDTVSDLIAEFYARRQQRAHEDGLALNGQTGYGTYPFPHIDGLKNFGRTDQCQGEVWISNSIMTVAEPFCDVIRTPASGARIYGRQVVQAEFDGGVQAKYRGPNDLSWRQVLHRAYANGLNLAVFNHVEHQPFEDKPGNVYYYMLSRHSPWWPLADATLRYMGRCQYLLQQGRFVADAAYFVGEGASRFVPGKPFLRPALPSGYDFDGINAEVLLTRATVRSGRLTLPDDLSYRYLVLCEPQCRTMTPETLGRIDELVRAGLTLIGLPPQRAPGLENREHADAMVRKLAAGLWGATPGTQGERQVGKGRVIWGRPMQEVTQADALPPDVAAKWNAKAFEIEWIHRHTAEAEIYFLANPKPETIANVEVALRVTGRRPELFDAMTGQSRPLPQYSMHGACTVMPLTFEPNEAYFVVFRQRVQSPRIKSRKEDKNFPEYKPLMEIAGPWEVQFDKDWFYPDNGTGGRIRFEKLEDWTARTEPAIRYYSGLATYETTFKIPAKASRMALSIGAAGVVARVRVNSQDCGTVSCPPWRVEIGSALREGENRLEIDVASVA
jgi:hypothetical protein